MVHALVGGRRTAASGIFRALAEKHATMIEAYQTCDFMSARILASELEREAPEPIRGLYRFNATRFGALAAAPPGLASKPGLALDEK